MIRPQTSAVWGRIFYITAFAIAVESMYLESIKG